MPTYRVKVRAFYDEIYEIDAETEDEAREYFYEGTRINSEEYDTDVESVERIGN